MSFKEYYWPVFLWVRDQEIYLLVDIFTGNHSTNEMFEMSMLFRPYAAWRLPRAYRNIFSMGVSAGVFTISFPIASSLHYIKTDLKLIQ